MFPGAFECTKSKDSEETLETLVDKLKTWQKQNADKRAVVLFAVDKDRTKEEGNTTMGIIGNTLTLLQLALNVGASKDSKQPIIKLFALALMSKIKDNL